MSVRNLATAHTTKWPQKGSMPSPLMQLKHIIVSVWSQGSMMGSTLAGNIPTWVIHMPPFVLRQDEKCANLATAQYQMATYRLNAIPLMQLKHIIVSVWPQGSMIGSTLAGNIPTWVIRMPPLCCGRMKNVKNRPQHSTKWPKTNSMPSPSCS